MVNYDFANDVTFKQLTKLEQLAIVTAEYEETGYIYFTEQLLETKTLRGVYSSLCKKGIIRPSYDQDFECAAVAGFGKWFCPENPSLVEW